MNLLHLLEPEETAGNIWHRIVGTVPGGLHFPDSAVTFEEMAPQLRVFFRGLGGEAGVDLKPAIAEISHHRLTIRTRIGLRTERIARAHYDGDHFSLPDAIGHFPEREMNEQLYFWLAAWTIAGVSDAPPQECDPLERDLRRLDHAYRTTCAVITRYPGLAKHYARLSANTFAQRPKRGLPTVEADVEFAVCRLLESPHSPASSAPHSTIDELRSRHTSAPAGYKTYLPVPLWGEIEHPRARERSACTDDEPGSGKQAGGDGKSRRSKRRATGEIKRKAGLFVHRFEKILTWTEFMNLHRDVEDDDEASARKAADDHDEIGVGRLEKKAATRLKIDLDLAPTDVDREIISDVHVYPEWDYRIGSYLPSHARILECTADVTPASLGWQPGPQMERRIRDVRRQFEALRPKREFLGRQLDGHELDMDALIRSVAELKARGEGSDHVFRQARDQARDLSVAVLIDVSRSTEGFVEDRAVIDIEREALIALSEGLSACGDAAGIFAFSSLRRDRVYISKIKDFDEPSSPAIRARIASLKPGFYTRLGAAIRHMSAALTKQPSHKRLLIVLTDGKPNDLDHYEGRYGVEDTRKAIGEARRAGQSVFGITIDSTAQSYFPRMFGPGGFAIVSQPARLPMALPVLYRHLIN